MEEGLDSGDAQLHECGYPTRASGHYTEEPVFGDLIRAALKLGYRVIPYEAASFKSAEERERGQAENLVNRIFSNEPRAKVVIHATSTKKVCSQGLRESWRYAGTWPAGSGGREILIFAYLVLGRNFPREKMPT